MIKTDAIIVEGALQRQVDDSLSDYALSDDLQWKKIKMYTGAGLSDLSVGI